MKSFSPPPAHQDHLPSIHAMATPSKRRKFRIPPGLHSPAPRSEKDYIQLTSAPNDNKFSKILQRHTLSWEPPVLIASEEAPNRNSPPPRQKLQPKAVEQLSSTPGLQDTTSTKKRKNKNGVVTATDPYTFTSTHRSMVSPKTDSGPGNFRACREDPDYECDLTRRLVLNPGFVSKTSNPSQPYTQQEDELIIHLRKIHNLAWKDIYYYFPNRTHNTLQSRYSRLSKDKAGNEKRQSRQRSLDSTGFDSSEDKESMVFNRIKSIGSTEQDSDLSRLRDKNTAGSDFLGNGRIETMQAGTNSTSSINKAHFLSLGGDSTDEDVMPSFEETYQMVPQTQLTRASNYEEAWLIDQCEKLRNLAAIASMTRKIIRSSNLNINSKLQSVILSRPYLNIAEIGSAKASMQKSRSTPQEVANWHGTIIHVDFLPLELSSIERTINALINSYNGVDSFKLDQSPRSHVSLDESMRNATDAHVLSLARHHISQGLFINRSEDSIKAFLGDVKYGHKKKRPSIQFLQSKRDWHHYSSRSIQRCLRLRELGMKTSPRQQNSDTSLHLVATQMKAVTLDLLGPLANFKSTSGDVNTVAWHPNGKFFAVGSAALTDDHSMQYNEAKNLLLGDVEKMILRELPEHSFLRLAPESGINSSREMNVSQSPLLFQTISAVQFSPDGDALVSAGFDKKVRVWDMRGGVGMSQCVWCCNHKSRVDVLAAGSNGLFATGTKQLSTQSLSFDGDLDTIFLYRYNLDDSADNGLIHSLATPRGLKKPELRLSPTSIRWGNKIHDQQKYLLCGYGALDNDYGEGHICLWDMKASVPVGIVRGSTNVFDVAWSHNIFGRFAVACTASSNVNKGTKSVVKIFDSQRLSSAIATQPEFTMGVGKWSQFELECPALDINDVIFNPSDENLISVGCTNGSVYLWDLRQPDRVLHHYRHGKALAELDSSRSIDFTDTGVRFISWNHSSRLLYTGSSDGVVACWNPYRGQDNTYIGKIAELSSGIMSGAFSPDFEHLLLGEVSGAVSTLTVHQHDRGPRQYESFSSKEAVEAKASHIQELEHELEIKARELSNSGNCDDVTSMASRRTELLLTNRHFLEKEELAQSGQTIADGLLQREEIQIKSAGGFPFAQAVQGPHYTGPYDNALDAPDLRRRSHTFQQSFKKSANACTLDHDIRRFTEEEQKDSKAWLKRIPVGLPKQEFDGANSVNFGLNCFRCGHNTCFSKFEDIYKCSRCKLAWRADVIGYSSVDFKSHIPFHVTPNTDMCSLMQVWEPGLRYFEEPRQELSRDLDYAYQHSKWGL